MFRGGVRLAVACGLWGCIADEGDLFLDLPGSQAGAGGVSGGAATASVDPPRAPGQAGLPNTSGSMSAAGGRASSGTAGAMADDAGASRDAGPECDPCPCAEGPFGPAEQITGLGRAALGPALSADSLTLYFSSIDEDAGEDIFSASRSDRGSAFSAASLVPNLDANGSVEGTPFISFDGLSLYFFSTREGLGAQGSRDIWLALRPDVGAPFAEPFVLPVVNATGLDHLPRLSRDETRLMFVSGRPSPNAFTNIWVAERASRAENFSEPVELAGVNSDVREEGFSLSGDGLTLLFASNRGTDQEDTDIWVATRSDTTSPFGAAENLSVVNSTAPDIDPTLSDDGFELFFSSLRSGTFELYRAVRNCMVP